MKASRTDTWLTPPFLIEALGGADSFDLDPCAPAFQPWPTARRTYTEADNGLALPWEGRIYLNPPYSVKLLAAFMGRMMDHNHGTALIFARTDTKTFSECVWGAASAVLFIRNRLHFYDIQGRIAKNDGGAPSVLVAYGMDDADILAARPIEGKFIPLRIPRNWLIDFSQQSWREALDEFFSQREGPVSLEEIYEAFAHHPKTRRNPHFKDKLRQTLQEARYVNVARGVWAPRTSAA